MTAAARPAVRSQPPPVWVMRHVVNPLVRAVARSPLGRWTGSLVVLRFVGRRSGRRYDVPVVLHWVDGNPTVITDGAWAANFRGGRAVTVFIRGRRLAGRGDLVQDTRLASATVAAALRALPSPRRLGLAIDRGHVPSDAELAAVRSVLRLKLDRP